jgi:hypothetical protein
MAMKEKLVPLRRVNRAMATIRRHGNADHQAELAAALELADQPPLVADSQRDLRRVLAERRRNKAESRRRIVEIARGVKPPRRANRE